MKVSVLGSCVSRVSLLNGDQQGHGIYNGKELGIELEYFLDKHNIALALMPLILKKRFMKKHIKN